MVDERRPLRWPAALDLWVVAVTVAVLWPMLRGGQLLARDLVFTRHPPLRPESFGWGSSAPRAVPLDAVVALLSAAVGGDILGRLALAGALVTAGAAAHRLCTGLAPWARALAAGLAIWNPFVLERLALGQWALILAYAALFPIVATTRSVVAGRRSPWQVGPWLALAGLTPTGALLGAMTALAVVCGGRRGRMVTTTLALLVQLPWLVPVLAGSAGATTDAAGFAAFAARAERGGGVLWSLLGLGGVWDAGSVVGSRAGALGHLSSLLVVVALVVAWTAHRRGRPSTGAPGALWLLGAAGLVLAWAPAFASRSPRVSAALTSVPGLGLLRDSQKWLAPFVVLVVLASASTAHLVVSAVHRRHRDSVALTGVVLALLPVVVMPDGGVAAWRTLTPSRTPPVVEQISEAVLGSNGRLVTAPMRSYRRFSWTAHRLAVYDPASRWFDLSVVTADRLDVGALSLPGEDPLARAVEAAWADPDPTTALTRQGVAWVVLYLDDPAAASVRTAGWALVVDSPQMQLWQLTAQPHAAAPTVEERRGLLGVVLIDLFAVSVLLGGGLWAKRRRRIDPSFVVSQ